MFEKLFRMFNPSPRANIANEQESARQQIEALSFQFQNMGGDLPALVERIKSGLIARTKQLDVATRRLPPKDPNALSKKAQETVARIERGELSSWEMKSPLLEAIAAKSAEALEKPTPPTPAAPRRDESKATAPATGFARDREEASRRDQAAASLPALEALEFLARKMFDGRPDMPGGYGALVGSNDPKVVRYEFIRDQFYKAHVQVPGLSFAPSRARGIRRPDIEEVHPKGGPASGTAAAKSFFDEIAGKADELPADQRNLSGIKWARAFLRDQERQQHLTRVEHAQLRREHARLAAQVADLEARLGSGIKKPELQSGKLTEYLETLDPVERDKYYRANKAAIIEEWEKERARKL